MDIREFNDHILLSKKAQFLSYVKQAAETIGEPIPEVNFEGCASFDEDLAHIHIEQNKICISEQYLKRATYEELHDTATHEVTHLIDETHNINFEKAHINVKTASWIREHTSNLIDDTNSLNSDCNVTPLQKVEKIETLEFLRRQYRILLSEIDDCVDRGHLIKRKELLDELFILSEKIRAIETPISEPTGEKPSHKPDWVEIENEKHKLDLSKISLEEKTTKELTEALKFSELKDKELAKIIQELHAEAIAEESNHSLSEASELKKQKTTDFNQDIDVETEFKHNEIDVGSSENIKVRNIEKDNNNKYAYHIEEKYKREYEGTTFHNDSILFKQNSPTKRVIKFWNKIKYKLNKKPYYNRFSSTKFFYNLVWMVILSITFAMIYYNKDVNKIIVFLPLGTILLFINGIFWIKYTYQLLQCVVYWYGDQRNWMKCLIVLIIFFYIVICIFNARKI